MPPSNTVQPPPPRISARDAKFATVIVGEEAAQFVIHEEFLTYYSPYFRAALRGDSKEAARGQVRLENVDADTFELFVHWLYHQRFPNETDHPGLLRLWYLNTSMRPSSMHLIFLYIFAEEHNVPTLEKQCIDSLFVQLQDKGYIFIWVAIRYAFDECDPDSALCRLLVHIHCELSREEDWDMICDDENTKPHPMFLENVLKRYTQYVGTGRRGVNEPLVLCDYHDHKDAAERNACASKVGV